MRAHHVLAALAAGMFAFGASAQNLKPGLWEVTTRTSGGEMEKAMKESQEAMAGMSPEQRKQMEAMMAKQGMKMGQAGPGGMSTQMCMSKEMAERNEMPAQQGDCKTTKQQRSGNTITMAWTCTNPPSSGEGRYTIMSPEAYTTKMTMRSTVQGKAETMTMDGSGKWLRADCGNLKPMAPPGKK
jgi:hypothetical protein